jgi:starvation-inducible DNA-binding protein
MCPQAIQPVVFHRDSRGWLLYSEVERRAVTTHYSRPEMAFCIHTKVLLAQQPKEAFEVAAGTIPFRLNLRGRKPMTDSVKVAPAVSEIEKSLRTLLADVFALYVKTKNFHWHMVGPHFRDYHLLLDEQGDQLFAMSDSLAERSRKLGLKTIHSIGEIASLQRIADNDTEDLSAAGMLAILCADNRSLRSSLADCHGLCEDYGDLATASLLENWIDETERRSWFLEQTIA